jgi:hypothetical protein
MNYNNREYTTANGRFRRNNGTLVILHIYDLSPANDYLYPVGLAIHHSGVEVLGVEYSFASGAGIFESSTPKIAPGMFFILTYINLISRGVLL